MLLASLTALLAWAGQAVGGAAGLWFALAVAAVMNIGTYWFADRIVLRMHDAQEVSPVQFPELYAMVHELAVRADLPMPKLYIVPEEAPNAFATGRNPRNGVVAVTEGLLRVLDRREVAAVIAHELGHIKNRDTLIMAIAATFAGALSMLANAAMFGSLFGGNPSSEEEESANPLAGLLGVMIAPIAATLVQMSISRAREFLPMKRPRDTAERHSPWQALSARSRHGAGRFRCTPVRRPRLTCSFTIRLASRVWRPCSAPIRPLNSGSSV
jgi:heat shock protein HtpX